MAIQELTNKSKVPMKIIVSVIIATLVINGFISCRSTKKLQSAISRKDTSLIVSDTIITSDSAEVVSSVLKSLQKHRLEPETFSAKIKVDYTDSRGKQPDVNAFVRIKKDSLIWISINATFLNIEAFRILISRDSMWILNKLEKEVEYHSLDYLENIAKIPLNFTTLQDLIIGNPIFFGQTIVAYRKTENRVLISTVDEHFKNLLTVSSTNNLVERSKLDDLDVAFNRTADLTYDSYENSTGVFFSTLREITVAEKTKVDILLNYKQYDFNKPLSFPFSIPKSYRKKQP